jgi:hypothetical protein
MRKIERVIDGLRYSTATAAVVWEKPGDMNSPGQPVSRQTLYRTERGRFFIGVWAPPENGETNDFLGLVPGGCEVIKPCSFGEAMSWATAARMPSDKIKAAFDALIEDA